MIKVEVGQYREVNKGTLKAFFSLVIYPNGQKILDCRYFVQGDKAWFNFPTKEVKKQDGTNDYIPLISYLDKAYLEELKIAVLEQLKSQVSNESTKARSAPSTVSSDKSGEWGSMPF